MSLTTAPAELDGRVGLVTGSTRGIGRAIAERFAAAGATVVVNGRDPEACKAVAAELPGSAPFPFDVGDAAAVGSAMAEVVERFGRIDVVVNNAGIALDNFITGVTDDRWQAVLDTNLTGAFHMLRAAVPPMKDQGGGSILNLLSWAGLRGNVGQAAYSASKAGLHGLTLSAAKELGKFGIRVNAIAPAVTTEMTDQMRPELVEATRKRRPLKRDGRPTDVAEAALFLSSDRAAFVTGVVLAVDGGIHLS